MTYLMSDIHGDFKSFLKILSMIEFEKSDDKLIIIGDIFDRNAYGMKILNYIRPYMKAGRIVLIKGNHEYFAELYLENKLSETRWSIYGGDSIIKAIKGMTFLEQNELLAFVKGLPHYIELPTEKYGTVVITHTGIDCDYYVYNQDKSINVIESIKAAVAADEFRYLISVDIHNIPLCEKKKLDKYIICGHVCTFSLNENASTEILRTPYYMDIDCGAGYREKGGRLGCYCLETDEVIYV